MENGWVNGEKINNGKAIKDCFGISKGTTYYISNAF